MTEHVAEHRVPLNTGRQWLRLVLGLLVLLAFVAYFVYGAVTTDETGKRVGGILFAAVFGAIAVAIGIGGAFAVKPRSLVATAEGLRLDGSRQPWRLRWADMRSIAVQSGYSLSGRPGIGLPQRLRRVATVRLLIELHDLAVPGPLPPKVFRGRWGASKTGFGIPLGPTSELVAPLDTALKATAGDTYTGVADLGVVRGFL